MKGLPEIKQTLRLIPSIAMQHSFRVLEMPHLELVEWLNLQIELNPLLEHFEPPSSEEPLFSPLFEELNFESSQFEVLDHLDSNFIDAVFPGSEEKDEQVAAHTPSLFEHLIAQAKELFPMQSDLEIAELLIGNLDKKGFLSCDALDLAEDASIPVSSFLARIQKMDPPGIGARTLRESLLLQLQAKNKEKALCYRIIDEHFDDLIHHRFSTIKKKLSCSQIALDQAIFEEIGRLSFNPASNFDQELIRLAYPDILISKVDKEWIIDLREEEIPEIKIKEYYLKAIDSKDLSQEDSLFVRKFLTSARALQRMIEKRNATLKKIILWIIEKESSFLDGEARGPIPLSLSEVASELSLHPSTIARALSDKLISFPQGMLPLTSFFAKASSLTAKELIEKLIEEEDKANPLSDEKIAEEICRHGLPCARRTVAKYRASLKKPSAFRRKKGLG
jgi:RNA polymerase sigma-54 factor